MKKMKDKRNKKKNIVILFYDKKKNMKINSLEIPIHDSTDFTSFTQRVDYFKDKYNIVFLDDHKKSIKYFLKNKKKIDLIVNLADNGYNNDFKMNGFFIEFFNFLGLKYTGRQANFVEIVEKKDFILYVQDYLDINFPKTIVYYPGINLNFLEKKTNTLKFPVLVKLGYSGDSITLEEKSICYSFEAVLNRINEIEKIMGKKTVLLVQEFIENVREYTTFIAGNHECDDIKAYTIKITPKKFYTYSQKADNEMPVEDYYKRCDLDPNFLKIIENKCVYLKQILNCKDYIRCDWLVDKDNNYYLIDFNANPAFDSEIVKYMNKIFLIEDNILGLVIDSALKR